ncbi:ShlB/FhaC/HecB family hemolysin secretion/activation protein [Azospirillum palustre]|uniref:ShlB/FhaC/HecB family hemolysin secretion/activation protein n=1 Tax=Azospirillum palustre TaxID=2044885 RepID=UPI00137940EF|nr:ShlB/FhaC/HecB family hemolysin secretion/activation protein [Azospirillum palustre]
MANDHQGRHRMAVGVLAAGLAAAGGMQARAQNFERIAPEKLETPAPQKSLALPDTPQPLPQGQQVLVARLRGLVFVGRADAVMPDGVDTPGIHVIPGSVTDSEDFRTLMAPYLGRPLTLDLLNEVARKTVLYFRNHDRPLVDVVVPEQNISSGVIQLVSMEFVAGSISAEGAEWFDDGQLLAAIRTKPGESISGQGLLDDINWLNENPFRHTDLVYQRGRSPGETDIVLRTRDRLPLRVYGGFENTGSKTTSENRAVTGFNWGNAFWLGHLLSYQYTASPDGFLHPGSKRYTAHAVTYQIPLPWRDSLTIMGSTSRSLPKLGDQFRQVGESTQISARYSSPLPTLEAVSQKLELGVDFKRTNNNLEFGGTSVSSGFTDIFQGVLGYSAARADSFGSTALALNAYFSPGGLSHGNTSTAFRPSDTHTGRSFADARYAYLRASVERGVDLPEGFTWLTRIQGQWASTNLLSSEQLGAGGADSIRGYGEQEVTADQGVIVTHEIRTPDIEVARRLGLGDVDDRLQLLGFWDAGRLVARRPVDGAKSAWTLSSLGIGMRYQTPYGSMRLAWGHAMPGTGQGNDRGDRLHFGVTLSY